MYTVEYLGLVAKHDIPLLPLQMKVKVKKAIEDRLMLAPLDFGKPLRYSLKGHRRLRVGDYRIVYRVELEQKNVIIVAIKHRKKVYKD